MDDQKTVRVGIGFATGRKSFQKVLRTYLYNCWESGLTEKENTQLNLLVAYDVKYLNTKPTDYTNVSRELLDLIDEAYFIGRGTVYREIDGLVRAGVIDEQEAKLFFGSGYAAQRNVTLYTAIKLGIDYLIFLDDDEYPMAVTRTSSTAIWSGQHVLTTHLQHIRQADITHGYHCGYISPIPYIQFNDKMGEDMFRQFIEAISNDIVRWDTIRKVMDNGGVTYADTGVLVNRAVEEVPEINHSKFISGGNLCINLTDPSRVFPFYNPPGARGEDTFLATCLSERKVLRVPCYTFHDGFSTYNHLMHGVLPIRLKSIHVDNPQVVDRFYRACVGWVRYKPLLLYITQPGQYTQKIDRMRRQLALTLPYVCDYFGRSDFMGIADELERYDKNVKKHYAQFLASQRIWNRIVDYLTAQRLAGHAVF